jgi:hypothetical protein
MQYVVRQFGSLVFGLSLIFGGCRPPERESQLSEAWNSLNDPARFGAYAGAEYSQIPTNARLSQLPWSDYYWAKFRGGISFRWQNPINSKDYRRYMYDIPSSQWVQSYTAESIARLSPAEKYDIAFSQLHLPLTRAERSRSLASVRNGEIPAWFGLCHGWAAAALVEAEPQNPVAVRNIYGQTVTFYASDLRALLIKAYSDANLQNRSLGQRCNDVNPAADPTGRPMESNCRDTNPGAFHLVISDYIAKQKRPFIADVSPASEVWNQPIIGYSFKYENLRPSDLSDPLNHLRAPGTVQLVDVEMTLEYAKERYPSAYAHGAVTGTESYRYTLELNDQGIIIGGEWISTARPDFLWIFSARPSGTVNGIDVDWVRKMVAAARAGNPTNPTPPENPPPQPRPPERPTPPPATGSLIIDFVSVNYRGSYLATANVWANVMAPPGSVVRASVLYTNHRQMIAQVPVQSSQRMSFSFNYSPAGSSGYFFELVDNRGQVLATVQRGLP